MKHFIKLNLVAILLLPTFVSAENWSSIESDTAIYGRVVKVKNVTLSLKKGIAEFPDAITERGSKHLKELQKIRNKKSIEKNFTKTN